MSKFFFLCLHCGHQVKAQDDWVGLEAQCPHCGHSIAITKPDGAPAPAAVRPETQEEKQCPFCGRMIKKEAVFCKHCKRDLPAVSGSTGPSEPEKTFPYICPDCGTFAELPLSTEGKAYECKGCAESHIATPATGRKCPYCGTEIKIRAAVCKYCRKQVPPLRSGPAWKTSGGGGGTANPASRLTADTGARKKIVTIGSVISIAFALLCCCLADCSKARINAYRSKASSGSSYSSPRSESGDFDIEKEKARMFLNGLSRAERDAFYGRSINDGAKTQVLEKLMKYDMLDGAIKLLEEEWEN